MTPEELNALRSIARKAKAEIDHAWSQPEITSKSQRDAAARKILLRYENKYAPRFTLPWISWGIGLITGRVKYD